MDTSATSGCAGAGTGGVGTSTAAQNGPVSSARPRHVEEVGKYKFIRTIGKGNFAKVKSARHLETGVEVAIKIIDKSALNSSSLQKVSRRATFTCFSFFFFFH